jgi:hypothetical protein
MVDDSVGTLSIKNFPTGLHVIYIYFSDFKLSVHIVELKKNLILKINRLLIDREIISANSEDHHISTLCEKGK